MSKRLTALTRAILTEMDVPVGKTIYNKFNLFIIGNCKAHYSNRIDMIFQVI